MGEGTARPLRAVGARARTETVEGVAMRGARDIAIDPAIGATRRVRRGARDGRAPERARSDRGPQTLKPTLVRGAHAGVPRARPVAQISIKRHARGAVSLRWGREVIRRKYLEATPRARSAPQSVALGGERVFASRTFRSVTERARSRRTSPRPRPVRERVRAKRNKRKARKARSASCSAPLGRHAEELAHR